MKGKGKWESSLLRRLSQLVQMKLPNFYYWYLASLQEARLNRQNLPTRSVKNAFLIIIYFCYVISIFIIIYSYYYVYEYCSLRANYKKAIKINILTKIPFYYYDLK